MKNTMKQMYSVPENSLGEIYIKYLEPINLKDYLGNLIGSDTLD